MFTRIYLNVDSLTTEEMKEILIFAENQETMDRYKNTTIHVNGNYAELDLEFTEDGDIIVL